MLDKTRLWAAVLSVASFLLGCSSNRQAAVPAKTKQHVEHDFDGNGKSDIVLVNDVSHQISVWFLGGNRDLLLLGTPVIGTFNSGWHAVTSGDLDGDGKPDILLQNATTNELSAWFLEGTGQDIKAVSTPVFPTVPQRGWHLVGAGDFDGTGKASLLLWNQDKAQISLWSLSGDRTVRLVSDRILGSTGGPEWRFACAADLNDDGKAEILVQNQTTRQIGFLAAGGPAPVATPWATSSNQQIVACDDFYRTGEVALLLENTATGDLTVMSLGSGRPFFPGFVLGAPARGWQVLYASGA